MKTNINLSLDLDYISTLFEEFDRKAKCKDYDERAKIVYNYANVLYDDVLDKEKQINKIDVSLETLKLEIDLWLDCRQAMDNLLFYLEKATSEEECPKCIDKCEKYIAINRYREQVGDKAWTLRKTHEAFAKTPDNLKALLWATT